MRSKIIPIINSLGAIFAVQVSKFAIFSTVYDFTAILVIDLVNFVLSTENIDTIMHFAAQTHVDNSFGNSFQFTQNNIMGTHVLLESAKVICLDYNINYRVHMSLNLGCRYQAFYSCEYR